MKAVVFHGIGDFRLEDVPEPTLREPTDAVVRGTMANVKDGRILGHEGVGVLEALGDDVRPRKPGCMKVKLDPHATDGARTPRASHA